MGIGIKFKLNKMTFSEAPIPACLTEKIKLPHIIDSFPGIESNNFVSSTSHFLLLRIIRD